HPILSWIYSDPDGDLQSAYNVQIDNNSNFSSLVHDSGWINSISNSFPTTGISLNWSTVYYWRVKVRDTQGAESSWSSSCSYLTPLHAYPDPGFSHIPNSPVPDENVQFTDETIYYGGSTGGLWSWTFETAGTSSEQNPIISFDSSGPKVVTLQVTDSDNYTCDYSDTINISFTIPLWREVRP
ncbi:hypothetical protein KKA23_01870, partial [Patescibacteria group bacterium]|nr:hypothetical protein [Patescibacteria group bacterium]